MKIVSAISLALALACFLSVYYAEAWCSDSMSCTACENNNEGCKWCSFYYTVQNKEFYTTIGYCTSIQANCSLASSPSRRAIDSLSPDPVPSEVTTMIGAIDECPATKNEIGTPTDDLTCTACIGNGNSFCSVVTGYPESVKAKTGGFCLSEEKAALCTATTFPFHSRIFLGATLTMTPTTDATDCCSVHQTCANCVKEDYNWCSVTFPQAQGAFDTTIGFCVLTATGCTLSTIPPAVYAAASSLNPYSLLSNLEKTSIGAIDDCPAAKDEIGTPTNDLACTACIDAGNSFCSVVTGYPGSGKAKTGGFCLSEEKAALCTATTFPLHSKAFPGATLTMTASTKSADCCSVYRTCVDCPPSCAWCDLTLTDGATDPKDIPSGFGFCALSSLRRVPNLTNCPSIPAQLSAMTTGLTPNPAGAWVVRYTAQAECGNHLPTYSTGAWSSFETKTACNANPTTAWCHLTGVARTGVATTTPLNSGGMCMDLFASGSCHAGWYLYHSPLTGFEMDGRF